MNTDITSQQMNQFTIQSIGSNQKEPLLPKRTFFVIKIISKFRSPVIPRVVVVKFIAFSLHSIFKQIFQVLIVWFLLKLQSPTIDQQLLEFINQSITQFLNRNGQLLLHYLFVFFLFIVGLKIHPRQRPLYQVEQNISYSFNIISPPLLNAQVSIQRGKSSCPSKIFVILVWDMTSILQQVSFCQTKINHINFGGFFPMTHDEIIWLHITMYKKFIMDILDTLKHLVSNHEGGLQIKLFTSCVKQIFERFPTQVHNHNVVLPLRTHIIYIGKTVVN